MDKLTSVSTAVLCLLILVGGSHGAPFFFPGSDCNQVTEAAYSGTGGYDDYPRPDYQETLQEVLRTIQEIVYLTVRAAQEELRQLASLWLPTCDSGDDLGAGEGVTQEEVSEGGWVNDQPTASQPSGQNTGNQESTLGDKVSNENSSFASSSSSSSETSSDGTRKTITTTNTTVITQEQVVGGSSLTNTKGVHNVTPLNDTDKTQVSESVTEEITTETVTLPDETTH